MQSKHSHQCNPVLAFELTDLLSAGQLRQLIAAIAPQEVLDTDEAAQYLGVSKQLLELLRVQGGGPPYAKLQRLVRYRRVALDHWLVEHERNHTTERP